MSFEMKCDELPREVISFRISNELLDKVMSYFIVKCD